MSQRRVLDQERSASSTFLDQVLRIDHDHIQEELRNQYSLGYTPDRADVGAGYHKIRLTTKQKDLIVQARDGYYAER